MWYAGSQGLGNTCRTDGWSWRLTWRSVAVKRLWRAGERQGEKDHGGVLLQPKCSHVAVLEACGCFVEWSTWGCSAPFFTPLPSCCSSPGRRLLRRRAGSLPVCRAAEACWARGC